MSNQPTSIDGREDLCCEAPDPIHSDDANSIPTEMLTVEKAQWLSEFLGFLADPNRL